MRKVLVAAGDGIGPEVVEATLFAMDALGVDLELLLEPVGMAGVQERGEAITDETIALAREADAVLFGAVETPPPGTPYRSPVLTLRKELGLYANVRPARPLVPRLSRLPEPLDVVVVRESTEGLYSGREREVEGGAVAEKVVTRTASERIHRFALRWALDHGRGRVSCVHKANVLRLSDGLFLSTFRKVAGDLSSEMAGALVTDDIHVDAAAALMVTHPLGADVLVTPNLYGDILSDLAAGLVGGLGFAPSGCYGERHALFEPIHGSAPEIAGEGIANPSACMLSAAMMLEHLGHPTEAAALEDALVGALELGHGTVDAGGELSTLGFAGEVRRLLESGG